MFNTKKDMRQEKWDKLNKELDDALEAEFGKCEHIKEYGCIKDVCTCNTGPKQEYQSECVCEGSCRGFVNVKCKQLNKQETLEEAADNWVRKPLIGTRRDSFIAGAKWKEEQIPSIIEQYLETAFISKEQGYMNPEKWFEQFKKK
jgi:hypothetical protein